MCYGSILLQTSRYRKLNLFYSNKVYTKIILHLIYFCKLWKATCPCTGIYLYFICVLLRSMLIQIVNLADAKKSKHEINTLILLYIKTNEIIRECNSQLQVIFFSTFLIVLGTIFYDALSIIIWNNAYNSIVRLLQVSLSTLCFLCICLSASSVLNAGKNAKYFLLKNRSSVAKELEHFKPIIESEVCGFTIFDSIVIDKSFILSSFGVLLTYGVIIMTFNQRT